MGNYIFGGGFLNSRLATRLRQKDGLSYGADSFITMNPEDNKAYERRFAALTADDVKRVMNKYLKLENFSIIKAGDMSKVEG